MTPWPSWLDGGDPQSQLPMRTQGISEGMLSPQPVHYISGMVTHFSFNPSHKYHFQLVRAPPVTPLHIMTMNKSYHVLELMSQMLSWARAFFKPYRNPVSQLFLPHFTDEKTYIQRGQLAQEYAANQPGPLNIKHCFCGP